MYYTLFNLIYYTLFNLILLSFFIRSISMGNGHHSGIDPHCNQALSTSEKRL